MRRTHLWPVAFLLFAVRAHAQPSQAAQAQAASVPALQPNDLTNATPEALLKAYGQLSNLQGSDQYAIAENVVWKRHAGTFTFEHGRLAFAAEAGQSMSGRKRMIPITMASEMLGSSSSDAHAALENTYKAVQAGTTPFNVPVPEDQADAFCNCSARLSLASQRMPI
jgi:hypothetical protein